MEGPYKFVVIPLIGHFLVEAAAERVSDVMLEHLVTFDRPLGCTASSSLLNSASRRLLVLHGKAGDGALMRRILELTGWLAELRAHGFEVEFLDAPHAASPAPELFASLAAAGEYNRASYFAWESATVDEAGRAAAVCESVRHVERWIEQHAPISGICGISDGALIAAAVAARSPSLQLFINFCSTPWERLPTSMDLEVPQLIKVPTLHVLGRADELMSTAQLWSVPSRCENMTTLWHEGGHVVPLLDGAVATALRRFLAAGVPAAIVHEPAGGVGSVVAEVVAASRIAAVERPPDIVSQQVFRILSSVSDCAPVTSATLLAPLGLSSMQIATLRDNLVEALAAEPEDIPLIQLLEWVMDDDATAGGLASKMSSLLPSQQAEVTVEPSRPPREAVDAKRRRTDTTADADGLCYQGSDFAPSFLVRLATQLVALPLPAAYLGASLTAPFLVSNLIVSAAWTHSYALLVLLPPAASMAYTLASALLLLAFKWLLLGRQGPCWHAVWSTRFARRWVVRQCMRLCWMYTPWAFLAYSPALTLLYQLLGCDIGTACG